MKGKREWLKKSGIYCIINVENQHRYIGSSTNITRRIGLHVSALRRKYHNNTYLQNAFNKYGEVKFDVYILEFTDDLLEREQFYIDTMNPEYNITIEVVRNTPSKESKQKHSVTKKRMYQEHILIPNCSKIIKQLSFEGELLQIYPSVKEASRQTGIHRTQIQRCLYEIHKQGGGYVWKYSSDNKVVNEHLIKAKRNSMIIKVENIDTKEKSVFYSINDCAHFFGVSRESIRYVIHKSLSKLYKSKFKIDLVKLDKLLETPEEDNQQPTTDLKVQ